MRTLLLVLTLCAALAACGSSNPTDGGSAAGDGHAQRDSVLVADGIGRTDSGGSGTCGPGSCGGCCQDGMCVDGTRLSSCGSGGVKCSLCAPPKKCTTGTCK